jgi:excisionase family DNA binding protein
MQQEISAAVLEAQKPILEQLAKVQEHLAQLLDQSGDRLVTPAEAAKILKCDVQTVRRKCNSGEIPFKRIGHKILIDRCAISSI